MIGDDSTVHAPRRAGQESHYGAVLEQADVAARFRAARRAGRPGWLWPDVEPTAWRAAMLELESATTALLQPGRSVRLGAADAGAVRALGVAAYTSGLGPWLGWQHEQGALAAGDAAAELLARHLAHSRQRARRLNDLLTRVVAALAEAGVAVTALKGVHTSRAYFPEPGLRPMADVDLLVPAATVPAAHAALVRAGLVEDRDARHPRPHRSEWRPAGSPTLPRSLDLSHADDPVVLDLHGSLDIDFYGVRTIDFAGLLDGRSAGAPWLESARWLPQTTVLRQPLLAAHLAVHASHGLHGATLIRLLELVLVLRADLRSATDWRALADLLRELRAERFAYPALLLAERLAPGTVDAALLRQLAAATPPRMHAVLEPLRPATAQRLETLDLRERFMWSDGAAEHARRVLYMLVPDGLLAPPRRLARIYRTRVYRLLHGQITRGG